MKARSAIETRVQCANVLRAETGRELASSYCTDGSSVIKRELFEGEIGNGEGRRLN